MSEPANDTTARPLTPLVFLCAAIRAECADARRTLHGCLELEQLDRVERLCEEIERHAEEQK